MNSNWTRAGGPLVVQQSFGRKVGHVLRHGKTWIAMLDGVIIGKFGSEQEAREAVESAGGMC